jgi:hypothetical protein
MELDELLQTKEYKIVMEEHISKTITYLFSQNQPFSVVCERDALGFSPLLPSEIYDNFKETVLFILQNYAFESATLDKKELIFETGFGSENFGSTVYIPLLAIKQVFIEEVPILLNLSQFEEAISTEENSMEMLLSNPKNRALFKS